MRRSNSFPGAALDCTASEKLANKIAAQLTSAVGGTPTSGSRGDSSADSEGQDTESLTEDWTAADDACSADRQAFLSALVGLGAAYQACTIGEGLQGLVTVWCCTLTTSTWSA